MKTYISFRDGVYYLTDNGIEVELVDNAAKGKPEELLLPENSSNRKYCAKSKVDKAPGNVFELTYKATIKLGERASSTSKNWEAYLNDDDKLVLEELKARAEANRQLQIEADKAAKNDPLAKAKREYEKWAKRVEELQAKAAE